MSNNTDRLEASALEQLLARYLDGQTTLEEEERLARYFRTATGLPDRLKPYRDMFAYFDGGMPIGEMPVFDGVPQETATGSHASMTQPRRIGRLWATLSVAAAAAAVLLLVAWPWGGVRQSGNASSPMASASADNSMTIAEPTDTTKAPQPAKPGDRQPSTGDKRIRRHHYDMAPPKVYYAGAQPRTLEDGNVVITRNDTAMAASNSRFLAEQKSIVEEQKQLQAEIEEMKRIANECKQNFVASGEFVDEYE